MSLSVRVRGPSGQQAISGLTQDTSLQQLLDKCGHQGISNHTDVKLKKGFPPKVLLIKSMQQSLKELDIGHGESLVLEVVENSNPSNTDSNGGSKSCDFNDIYRQEVPADNNCLFTCVYFCISATVEVENSKGLRQIVSTTLEQKTEKYPEAFLGKPREEYCEWILSPDSWGGAIEAQVLAEYLGIVITVIDTQTGFHTNFGEDLGSTQRMILIYDGIHYDALCKKTGENRTLFPITDDETLEGAKRFVKKAREDRKFTDVNNFSLRCLTCQERLSYMGYGWPVFEDRVRPKSTPKPLDTETSEKFDYIKPIRSINNTT